MPLKSALDVVARPLSCFRQSCSFINLLRSQTFHYSVPQELLTSTSMRLVNPRNHCVKTDMVSLKVPATQLAGLNDEEVLALFTKGFFGGWVFAIERTIMRMGLGEILPARFTTFKSRSDETVLWRKSEIPKDTLVRHGDILFGSFKNADSHIHQEASGTTSSYVDFCFGSDTSRFGGCQRFHIVRNTAAAQKDSEPEKSFAEIRLEHFRCNPAKNVESIADKIPLIAWFHYYYAKLLHADGVRSILRR